MPRSPDSTTDTYLGVLRTLGVPDAALERHHDAGPETPLRVAIDGDRGSPTADLLAALDATGRLLDLRDGLASDDGDRLTSSLARFGLRVACDAVVDGSTDSEDGDDADDASPDADLELHVTDDVTGGTVRITTARDAEAAVATLREELPGADAIRFVELLDGRYLVATPRELHRLAERYGARLQPYDDPLLVPEAAVDLDDRDVERDDHERVTESPSVTSPSSASASDRSSTTASDPSSATAPAPGSASASTAASAATTDADESFGDFVSAVDDSAAEAVESALEASGSTTHTIEGDGEDVAAASSATVGGGPKRTVSTSGIDDVFEQLESSAPDDDLPSATTQTMSESSDPPTDATASSDDADTTPNGLTGGPTRTVSTKSADDILQQATGERDFEEIAAEEGDADPDAVLADAEDVPPALEDSDVAAPLGPGNGSAATAPTESVGDADEPATDADEPVADADEPAVATDDPAAEADEAVGAADVPPADPAATAAQETEVPIAVAPQGEEATSAASGGTDAAASGKDDPDPVGEKGAVEENDGGTGTGSATPTSPAAEGEGSDSESDAGGPSDVAAEAASSDDANAGSTLPDDELLEDDVELRRGAESIEQPAAPAADSLDADPTGSAGVDLAESPDADSAGAFGAGTTEASDADGPLAAAGGVERPDTTGAASDSADGASSGTRQPAPTADDMSGEPDASAVDPDVEESSGTEDDPGLVGRITSTIFGR